MKRDMSLIRLLLIDLEGEQEADLSQYSKEQIEYHNYLLVDSGLALGWDTTGGGQKYRSALVTNLTWEGHDFLDAARDKSVWNKALRKLGNASGSVSFDVIKALLIAIAKDQLGL